MEEEQPIKPHNDKVAESPGMLPYAHTVGGVVIKPIDKGRTKGLAVEAMRQQTTMQMVQIQQQIELLATQARAIQERVQISEWIYEAELNFKPIINHVYHLYRRSNGRHTLSMVGPREWGPKGPSSTFVASIRLLADHTWDILERGDMS